MSVANRNKRERRIDRAHQRETAKRLPAAFVGIPRQLVREERHRAGRNDPNLPIHRQIAGLSMQPAPHETAESEAA